MKILELHLRAYGPFADRTLDFSEGHHGLHVVYGPNEAGKSSTLRALKALLYGFPHSTSDDFRHPSQQLRVGGRLRHSDGTEIEVVRKKGRKRTLLAPDDSPLPDDTLARFLTGVGEKLFETLFGIDHATLIQGGQEILQQKGEIGQALFSAGVGAGRLRKLLACLETEADELFKPRGSNPLINRTLSELDAARRSLKEAALPARQWQERRGELDTVTARLEQVEHDVAAFKTERRRLQALERALPRFAARRRYQQRLSGLAGVIELPADFASRRQDVQRRLEAALEQKSRAEKRLAELERERLHLVGPKPLLDQAVRLDTLREQYGSHKKALADRPKVLREATRQLDEARHLLRRVRPDLELDQVERLRPAFERRSRLLKLAQERLHLVERLEEEEAAARRCETTLASLQARRVAVEEPEATDELQAAAKAARRHGDLDDDFLVAASEVERMKQQLEECLARLPFGPHELDVVARLAAPPSASVSLFERRLCELEERWRQQELARERALAEVRELEERLAGLEASGSVPSEEELLAAREERDRLWRELRQRLEAGDPSEALSERFEIALRQCDELSDRLRREADRVHQVAAARASRDRGAAVLQDLEGQLERLAAERESWQREWSELWRESGLEPRSPAEMASWLEERRRALEMQPRLTELESRLRVLTERRLEHCERLASLLGELEGAREGTLAEWIARADDHLEATERLCAERRDLVRSIEDRTRELVERRAEIERRRGERAAWDDQWAAVRRELELGDDVTPDQADELSDDLDRLFKLIHEAKVNERRVKGIDDDAGRFEDEVRDFSREVAPDLAELPVDVILTRLKAQLEEARRLETLREENESQIRERREEKNNAESAVETMQARLAALRAEAHCEDGDDLEAIERRSTERRELRLEIERLESQLLEDGEGADLEDLEREAAGVTPAALDERSVRVARELEQVEAQRNDLYTQLGALQGELDRMDGSARSAELAERMQGSSAALDAAVRQYVRLRLAAGLLRREIERYRQENQAPVLRRAGERFVQLTLGSFERLVEDVDDKERPILVGIRPGGDRVAVGGMSEGTCDQLYLALRLATLEQHLERVEPLPFIVDDILINFDDTRSRATLEVLADLAQRTQVILFTHHRRILETARELSQSRDVWLHALGAAGASEAAGASGASEARLQPGGSASD